MDLILASQSGIRQHILTSARLAFTTSKPRIDEQEITKSLIAEGALPRDIPDTLAELKAQKISNKNPGAMVLGCDQVLVFDGQIYGKPATPDDLVAQLNDMQGKEHRLITGNVVYRDGKPLWRHVGIARLVMQTLSLDEIQTYVANTWENVHHCAGGYQFENTPDLFRSVKGDWFDIMGLSIGPLIGFLDQHDPDLNLQKPKLAAVLGHPINHSKSPKLHGTWLAKYKISGDYMAIDTAPDHFQSTVKMLIDLGFQGFNVTIPHKEAALAMADITTEVAQKMGASNTLVVQKDKTILADNTDGFGFMRNILSAQPDWDATAGPVLILGAGGAARAIVVSLLDAGAPEIFLTNRTKQRAEMFAQEFGNRITVVDWENRNDYAEKSMTLVNTTSLGMTGKPPLEIDLGRVQPGTLVTDLVYTPLETDLLKQASLRGCKTVGGLGMLLHQGRPGFESWFGVAPTVDADLEGAVLS